MKSLVFGMMMIMSFSTIADCTDVYYKKAIKRKKRNMILAEVGVSVGAVAAGALIGHGLESAFSSSENTKLGAGVGAVIGAGVAGSFIIEDGIILIDKDGVGDNNKYYKSYHAIEAAKSGKITNDLKQVLVKETHFDVLSDFEQADLIEQVSNFINEEIAANGMLCRKKRGKFRAQPFKSFSKLIVKFVKNSL